MEPHASVSLQPERRVLIVDDDAADRLLIKRAFTLSTVNNTVFSACDGEEALGTLRQLHGDAKTPHLILLDLNMPGMDGWDTLRHIRADAALARLPVVVLTTSDSARDVSSVYALNANRYIKKPRELAEFTEVVLKTCEFWLQLVKSPVVH